MVEFANNPLKDLPSSLKIPDLSTATLEEYIPRLRTNWKVATQLATPDGLPYYRSYSRFLYPEDKYTIKKVDLGRFDPVYEGTFYYRVSSFFIERVFTGNVSLTNPEESFLRWTRRDNRMRMEEIFAHKVATSVTWNRPFSGSIEAPMYGTLPEFFTLPLIQTGKACSAEIRETPPGSAVEIRLKSSPQDPGEVVTGNFLLTKPLIQIRLLGVQTPQNFGTQNAEYYPTGNAAGASHRKIEVDFYGEFKWANYLPTGLAPEGEKTLIHPITTPLSQRYLPPGVSNLPEDFWNSVPDNLELEGYSNRGSVPSWY